MRKISDRVLDKLMESRYYNTRNMYYIVEDIGYAMKVYQWNVRQKGYPNYFQLTNYKECFEINGIYGIIGGHWVKEQLARK